MNKHIFILIAVAMIGFTETMLATAQSNSTNSDRRNIIVTWLEANDTKTSATPAISVSSEDFWIVFGPLIERTINGSTSSFE